MSAVGSEKTEQILQLKGHSCPFVMFSQGEAESNRNPGSDPRCDTQHVP